MKNTAHPVDRTANWCSHGGWFTLAVNRHPVQVLSFTLAAQSRQGLAFGRVIGPGHGWMDG
jgi:hypothetical protein